MKSAGADGDGQPMRDLLEGVIRGRQLVELRESARDMSSKIDSVQRSAAAAARGPPDLAAQRHLLTEAVVGGIQEALQTSHREFLDTVRETALQIAQPETAIT